jgi:hypothetical protein
VLYEIKPFIYNGLTVTLASCLGWVQTQADVGKGRHLFFFFSKQAFLELASYRTESARRPSTMISEAGTMEDVRVVRGHPMLVGAAVDAVSQWRYRPYILNNEAIEVETQITVNFTLAGN